MTVRVLLVDDDPMMRECLRTILERDEGVQVVGEASDGRMVLGLVAELAPEVVVIDVSMPGMNGLEATRLIKSVHPDVRVITVSSHADERYVEHMLDAGACGYVLKASAHDDLVHAVRFAGLGRTYLSIGLAGSSPRVVAAR